ncbi:NDR1/HIN1-like protein 6 [Bienertia sinuspersici]
MYPGQPNYVMLQPQYGPPPPYYSPQPYHSDENRRSNCGNCCMRCICCVYCLLFILILIFATGIVLTYTFYKPKIPIYKLQDLSVTAFSMQPDLSMNAELEVTVTAENPNTKIGFIYGKDSSIVVSFEDSILCSGKVPSFHQGHENVTTIKIPLSGKTKFSPDLSKALTADQDQGRIPLLVQVIVPVTVVMETLPLRQFQLHVSCHMTVDNLRPDKKPQILSSTNSFGFGF